ncbi:glycosyltransferase [uncultured Nocardioides sp.]|uniref:glycosyltransferase family 2 protein n=1 Tax=uncultured Nocardioides sp. TaxID=198441 RepID=UPI0025FEA92B|nr:glycosyltransferase [uncultured Nocardioides sp.]
MTGAPLFSVVTPVYAPPLGVLAATIDSVLAQEHQGWELVLVDDLSPDPGVRDLLRRYAARDPRIRVVERETNGHIVAASNDGIAAARGTFVALLDHDDLLHPTALARNAERIAEHDDVDYLYSDEDKVDDAGTHYDTFRKPAWSPERLRGQMYTAHLSVIRTDLVREVGGFREGYDGSQDHDLVLRVTERARRVVHIPEVLYHWRNIPGSAAASAGAKPYAWAAGRQAVQDHLDRLGLAATADFGAHPGMYTLSRHLDPDTVVSLVIPTIGKSGMIWGAERVFVVEAVRTVMERTRHPALEIVVVYDPPTPPSVLRELRRIAGDRLRLVEFTEPFNYSRKMNLGVLLATGDRLVFLNDDVSVRSDHWLEDLVGPLEEPDVGMTGAKLYFGNTTIQHAGHAYSGGHYLHPFIGEPGSTTAPFGSLKINREASGVTAACSAMRRDTFFEVGGFAEKLPLNFNDVDLCYKTRRQGYRIVWVATAELFHFESRSRERVVERWEKAVTVARWGAPVHDPYLPESRPVPAAPVVTDELGRSDVEARVGARVVDAERPSRRLGRRLVRRPARWR